ncbi:DUF262 domain-containing protein [Pectobacterium brasiliense]|uniref:DUF262 domain-containing protein n=1 Tax=Pectobacterium TaxID=122277 RepID=UPI001969283D|nr:DUF262 domain-containing protein [Pectobacterium brasiliense]MBN3041868.1 DUF262 domain-containing protein [Pectobacterium brasiliense]
MELHAYTRTILELLSVNRKYIVPRFQREYSWTKEQINELWLDIISNINCIDDNGYEHSEYFIGSLVLIGDETGSSMQIVDGQQRLTTLTILLSVLCEKFKETGVDALATALYDNYIAGRDDDNIQFFKLVNETPKPFFQRNIQHITKSGERPNSPEEKNLQMAYDELYSSMLLENIPPNLLNQNQDSSYINLLKAIREQVLRYLKVIFITVNEEDEAYTIFETLNARGMNLSYVDLIKNKIFKALNEEHPDDNAKTKWNLIKETIASRPAVGSMETFIRHWWVSRFSYVSSDKLYKSFTNKWRSGDIEASVFIEQLLEDSKIYVKISSPIDTDFPEMEMKQIYRSLQAIKLFNITQNKPFILSLFKARSNGKLKLADMKRVFFIMERFHFLFNAVCSLRPSGIEGAYSKAARALIDLNATVQSNRAAINDLVSTLRGRKPDLQTFTDKFRELNFTNKETKQKRLIQYIFTGMEHDEITNGEFFPDAITIEHVIPQSTGNISYIGKIGNLLPLSKEMNERVGNRAVADKINIYRESNYFLVRSFVSDYEGVHSMVWNEEKINERSAILAKHAYMKIWNF